MLSMRFLLESEIETEIAVTYDWEALTKDGPEPVIDTVHVLIDGSELGYFDDDTLPPALRAKVMGKIPPLTKEERDSMAWAEAA